MEKERKQKQARKIASFVTNDHVIKKKKKSRSVVSHYILQQKRFLAYFYVTYT